MLSFLDMRVSSMERDVDCILPPCSSVEFAFFEGVTDDELRRLSEGMKPSPLCVDCCVALWALR